jgi:SNF2 family DNA or RNA helicase
MISKLNGIRPAPYQLVALTKLLTNSLRGLLIADGVGVGKTISSAYAMLYLVHSSKKPGMVVCPPSLVPKWIEELKSKFGVSALPIRAPEDLLTAKRESTRTGPRVPIYVMSNSVILRTKLRDYPDLSLLIFDEIHNYRNKDTQSFDKVSQLSRLAENRIGLSATPINNSLDDLVSELQILMPDTEWDALQATVEEVWRTDKAKLTVPLVTRFTKEKLRIHFAKRKIETRSVSYEPGYPNRVQTAISRLHLRRGKRGSLYEDITYYRLAASSPYSFARSLNLPPEDAKEDHKLENLKEILSSEDVTQWLVFCAFEDTVEYLRDHIDDWECYTMTGSTPMFDRPSIMDSFRGTHHSLLIMTEVGSEGLDLQFCRGVVNYDLHWNPMRLEQRIGRVDRVGQTKEEVIVYNIVVDGSIDERVIQVVRRKLDLLEGSVFSPGTLFGEYESRLDKRTRLFDDKTLSHELEESNTLFGALKYTNELSIQDYEILPAIDEKYCIPESLIGASTGVHKTIPWVRDSPTSQNWFDAVRRSSTDFGRLVQYYS